MNAITYKLGRKTAVYVLSEPDSTTFGQTGFGTAICSPTDVYDARIGADIALGRAIQDLGQKVARDAEAKCVTKDQAEANYRAMIARFAAGVDDDASST